jgi:alpha-mannosidase
MYLRGRGVRGTTYPRMRRNLFLGLILLASLGLTRAQEKVIVFQIGKPDGDYGEFAIAGNYAAFPQQFPHDVDFVVGQSDAQRQWPFIHPGPTDAWAGSRSHAFKITFALPDVLPGYYRLVIDLVSTHYASPPRLTIDINGTQLSRALPLGKDDAALTNAKAGKNYSLQQLLPSSLLRAGTNSITLVNSVGSWALYDDIRLESGAPAPPEPVRAEAQAVPWFKRTPAGPRRVVKVSVQNLVNASMPAEVAWTCAGQSGSQKAEVRFGDNELYVAVPEVRQKAAVGLVIKAGGQEAKVAATLAPARKWRVYIVPTVHTDIGYTDLQERVMARHADNTRQALAMADKYASFKWDFETYWQLDCFLRAHPEQAEEVFRYLREGRMGLSAFFGNMLTGLCSHEALNRSTLNARNLAIKGGFPIQSVILDDVPAAIGSLPMVLAHSGIKYFIEGVNGDRAPHATHGLKNPFYWEGPDGSRVLCHIAGGYAMAGGLISSMERAAEQLPGYLASYEAADYPYDAVLVNGAFSDNQGVASWLPEVVEKWNAEWEYPKLILARPADFFGYIEQNFAAKIPVLKTDFGGWWEDGAASTARETALCRRAEERAVTAEMLHSLAALLAGTEYPKAAFGDLWRNILLYDEHTWGAWCSISDPKNEQTVKQWEVKGSFARKADEKSWALLDAGMGKLAVMTPAADLVVFNPLSWSRKAIVTTTNAEAVVDLETKRTIPCQALPEGGSCFIATDLPSVGYRSYRNAGPVKRAEEPLILGSQEMENEFYHITLDPRTGAPRSILDKETGRELVDAKSEYGFGEVIYVSGGEGTYAVHSDLNLPAPKFTYHRQSATRAVRMNGPVFSELTCVTGVEKLRKITQRIRLYHGLKRLDLNYEIDKDETTAKEAVYIAFPFALEVEKGGLWLEYPDAITEPLKDQHSSACRDWYSVQRWLAASDGTATVVLSPLDTPLVTLGGMTGSTWPRQLSLKRAHVFAYVMNNYWHTNYKAEQGGRHVFRFSLTSRKGAFSKPDAVREGWEMFCPPVAQRGQGPHQPLLSADAETLVSIQPSSLPLMAFKQAEDDTGFIFRVCDFSGVDGALKLTLPKTAVEALSCDLVEANARKQQGRGKTVTVPVKAFSPVTINARFAPTPPS